MSLSRKFCVYLPFTPLFTSCRKHELRKRQSNFRSCYIGLFTVRLPKLVAGTHFPDLDMITKLLAPSGKCNIPSPGIEVISDETPCDSNDQDGDFEWEWNQEFYDEEVRVVTFLPPKVGTAHAKKNRMVLALVV